MPSLVHIDNEHGMVFFLDPLMRLGIDEIDNEHAVLFSIISRLNEELKTKTFTDDEKKALFEEIICYANKHFETEERLFKLIGYSHTERHIANHHEILGKLMTMMCNKTPMIVTSSAFLPTG